MGSKHPGTALARMPKRNVIFGWFDYLALFSREDNRMTTSSGFIVVVNGPNRIATVHARECVHLGANPEQSSASATRRAFDDRLRAVAFAQDAMPRNFVFCGHCQAKIAITSPP